ncbi:unnamed protein product [Hymenolepis diminuta]|uniref:C2 NT-type domain-containing protein n=1 Tax=Hymenolepis diminuta TaxID=6216 RepID=A0A0R3SQG2_HYMDI|nr:unnamed protein product [Hymenolepis diminuta]
MEETCWEGEPIAVNIVLTGGKEEFDCKISVSVIKFHFELYCHVNAAQSLPEAQFHLDGTSKVEISRLKLSPLPNAKERTMFSLMSEPAESRFEHGLGFRAISSKLVNNFKSMQTFFKSTKVSVPKSPIRSEIWINPLNINANDAENLLQSPIKIMPQRKASAACQQNTYARQPPPLNSTSTPQRVI